jgi:hypothetical protein
MPHGWTDIAPSPVLDAGELSLDRERQQCRGRIELRQEFEISTPNDARHQSWGLKVVGGWELVIGGCLS